MWECDWWSIYKTDASVKFHLRENFPNERLLSEEQLLQGNVDGKLSGYVQYDIEIAEHLRSYFSNFFLMFENTVASRKDFGTLMKRYAEKNTFWPSLKECLYQVLHQLLERFSPLNLFHLKRVLACKRSHLFVWNIPKKCFTTFVQSSVNAQRQGDENPNSSVVGETMKLLANSSYGYQGMDRCQPTLTKYLNDEKRHNAINGKMFKHLNHITDQLYEVEMAKPEIEHREPFNVGFSIL